MFAVFKAQSLQLMQISLAFSEAVDDEAPFAAVIELENLRSPMEPLPTLGKITVRRPRRRGNFPFKSHSIVNLLAYDLII